MATYDQIRSLCTAFAQRNDARFRRTVSQMAARMSAARGQELLRLVNDAPRIMEIIPSEARGVVYEAPACDVELSLSESLSRELELLRREWRAAAELRDAGLCPRGRLLFWGPPGNGKSTAAAQVGTLSPSNAFCIVGASVFLERFLVLER